MPPALWAVMAVGRRAAWSNQLFAVRGNESGSELQVGNGQFHLSFRSEIKTPSSVKCDKDQILTLFCILTVYMVVLNV